MDNQIQLSRWRIASRYQTPLTLFIRFVCLVGAILVAAPIRGDETPQNENNSGVDIQINDTATTSDDIIPIDPSGATQYPATPCQIRSTTGAFQEVILSNGGSGTGTVFFNTAGQYTLTLDLPADGEWVPFGVIGATPSTQPWDGAINITELDQLVSAKPMTVTGADFGLMLTTIQDNPGWPGARPATLLADLGYAVGAAPSDTQICIDVLTHTTNPVLQPWLNNGLVIAAPWGGAIQAGYNINDETWLTLALLHRSVNPAPQQTYTLQQIRQLNHVENFINVHPGEPGDLADFRPLNDFNALYLNNNPSPKTVCLSIIGATPFEFNNDTFKVHISYNNNGIVITGDFNFQGLTGSVYVGGNKADPGDNNDAIWQNADGSITHRTAGRAGPFLEPAERYVDQNMYPPPFFSELTLQPANHTFSYAGSFSSANNQIWPTADGYHYDPQQQLYVHDQTLAQDASPFVNFLQHTIPWPPGVN
jgi:hypothetical protein